MHDLKWTSSEKKLAQRVFDAALQAELAGIVADFKARAAAASTIDDVWAIEAHLTRTRRDLDQKYEFRYSQLLFVFGRLLREGRISMQDLAGLSAEKQDGLRYLVSL